MKEELTKSGKPITQRTFGVLVCNDKSCRHYAVELGFFDIDLRLYGRYLHHNGYRTLEEARQRLKIFSDNKIDPFVGLKSKKGKLVDFQEWKNTRGK